MDYIRVTKENLEKEHICCAISNNKDVQVSSKKAWLADRFDEARIYGHEDKLSLRVIKLTYSNRNCVGKLFLVI